MWVCMLCIYHNIVNRYQLQALQDSPTTQLKTISDTSKKERYRVERRTFIEALNNDVDEVFNTSKRYHVITSHNMKRTL